MSQSQRFSKTLVNKTLIYIKHLAPYRGIRINPKKKVPLERLGPVGGMGLVFLYFLREPHMEARQHPVPHSERRGRNMTERGRERRRTLMWRKLLQQFSFRQNFVGLMDLYLEKEES